MRKQESKVEVTAVLRVVEILKTLIFFSKIPNWAKILKKFTKISPHIFNNWLAGQVHPSFFCIFLWLLTKMCIGTFTWKFIKNSKMWHDSMTWKGILGNPKRHHISKNWDFWSYSFGPRIFQRGNFGTGFWSRYWSDRTGVVHSNFKLPFLHRFRFLWKSGQILILATRKRPKNAILPYLVNRLTKNFQIEMRACRAKSWGSQKVWSTPVNFWGIYLKSKVRPGSGEPTPIYIYRQIQFGW